MQFLKYLAEPFLRPLRSNDDQLLLMSYFGNFDFLCSLLLKECPIFNLQF